MKQQPLHYYSHRGRRKHPSSVLHRVIIGLILPIALVLAAATVATGAFALPHEYALHFGTLLAALAATLLRLLISYGLCLAIGIPLGVLAESNHRVESILLPVYDVLESIPVLAFFPIVILFFVHSGLLEGAAIFILFFSMVWNIIFSTIGGLKVIPSDVRAAGKVFGLSWIGRFFTIELPALFPPLVTGSILSVAAGWNLVIVAEALHAYAPSSSGANDLFGIGSVLVNASAAGDTSALIWALLVLVVAIAAINIGVWQPLLARAERYKFE